MVDLNFIHYTVTVSSRQHKALSVNTSQAHPVHALAVNWDHTPASRIHGHPYKCAPSPSLHLKSPHLTYTSTHKEMWSLHNTLQVLTESHTCTHYIRSIRRHGLLFITQFCDFPAHPTPTILPPPYSYHDGRGR